MPACCCLHPCPVRFCFWLLSALLASFPDALPCKRSDTCSGSAQVNELKGPLVDLAKWAWRGLLALADRVDTRRS